MTQGDQIYNQEALLLGLSQIHVVVLLVYFHGDALLSQFYIFVKNEALLTGLGNGLM